MKLLIITGAHPTSSTAIGGLFISRNIKKLVEYGVECDIISYYINNNKFIRLIKILLRHDRIKYIKTINSDSVNYNFLSVNESFEDRLRPHKLIDKMVLTTIQERDIRAYDLIHAHWVYPHGYIASLLKQKYNIPCIISALGSDIHTHPYENPNTIPLILSGLHHADIVFFMSEALLKKAEELGYQGKNYRILSYGVDTDLFVPTEKDDVRRMLGVSPLNKKIVGFIGNLISVKGADRLPEIFKGVAEKLPDVQFVIVGSGVLRDSLEERFKKYQLNVVFFSGLTTEEVVQWINALDLLVVPSRNEGLPNVILEALACGCPIVGSDVGGIPEAIGNGGKIVQMGPDFETRFSDAVITVMSDPPDKNELRQRALKYDWREIVREQVHVYEEVIQSKIQV